MGVLLCAVSEYGEQPAGAPALILSILLFLTLSPLYAQSSTNAKESPRPAFIDRRPYIPERLLKDKHEGKYVAAMPAIGFDAEEGVNVGFIAQFFDNGTRGDPFFATAPYRRKISVAAKVSTKGVQKYVVGLDQPYLGGSPYRLRVGVSYQRTDLRNYFGIGSDAMRDFNFPGASGTFESYESYQDALRREVDGFTYTKYNNWKSREFDVALAVERDMLGGIVRPLLGLNVSRVKVDDFTGDTVDATNAAGQTVDATQLPTKLLDDCEAGIVDGCDGGWDNYIKVGLSLDTRDFEPDPTAGVLAQISADLSTRALGSTFDYQRVTVSAAGFTSPFSDQGTVTLVGRALYSMQFGDVPFYAQSWLAFNTLNERGLGGFSTMRGYLRDRFVGRSAALVNTELRWRIGDGRQIWGQHLQPMVVPFVDAGRVFNGVGFTFDGWRAGYGIGLKLAWNIATVVSFDVGVSTENKIFYMELGHAY